MPGKRIRDPIHKTLVLDEAAVAVIDAPRFQRLRHVRQLGMATLVYPGANHTRFEHSLGAHFLGLRAAEALGVARDEARTVALACLLHDAGHGPMSHLSDSLYAEFLHKGHAEVSRDIVLAGTIRDALEAHGVSANEVADLIVGRGPLGELVAGELDCDRMDYLARDSYYTGVASAVDPQRLAQSFELTKDDGLLLKEDGLSAAEAFLVSRFTLYTSVYYHPTSRVAELMVVRAARMALEAGEVKPEDLPRMDDVAFTYLLRHSKTEAWRLMLLVDQRRLHKVAREYDRHALGPALAERLAGNRNEAETFEREIASGLGLKPADVYVDAPDLPILTGARARVLKSDGAIVPISKASRLVGALEAAHLDGWRLRVIVPASKREAAGALADRIIRKVA